MPSLGGALVVSTFEQTEGGAAGAADAATATEQNTVHRGGVRQVLGCTIALLRAVYRSPKLNRAVNILNSNGLHSMAVPGILARAPWLDLHDYSRSSEHSESWPNDTRYLLASDTASLV